LIRANQLLDLTRLAVADSQPQELGREAAQHRDFREVRILRDDGEIVLARIRPHI